jgi:hypothetical protein
MHGCFPCSTCTNPIAPLYSLAPITTAEQAQNAVLLLFLSRAVPNGSVHLLILQYLKDQLDSGSFDSLGTELKCFAFLETLESFLCLSKDNSIAVDQPKHLLWIQHCLTTGFAGFDHPNRINFLPRVLARNLELLSALGPGEDRKTCLSRCFQMCGDSLAWLVLHNCEFWHPQYGIFMLSCKKFLFIVGSSAPNQDLFKKIYWSVVTKIETLFREFSKFWDDVAALRSDPDLTLRDRSNRPIAVASNATGPCEHYQRACLIRCSSCFQFVGCHKCHPEADQFKVSWVKCTQCEFEQRTTEHCARCGLKFGHYSCLKCGLFDSRPDVNIFHCDECKMCRLGLRKDWIHCHFCAACVLAAHEPHLCSWLEMASLALSVFGLPLEQHFDAGVLVLCKAPNKAKQEGI